MESNLIVACFNYTNQTFFFFFNGWKAKRVESMVFDAKKQAMEGGIQVL